MKEARIEKAYELARERYAECGVDTEEALHQLGALAISMHCWQGDDVTGFEKSGSLSDGGIMATGNYPGKARTPDELRSDMAKALSLVPGKHRANIHALYAETGGKKVERDQLAPEHFSQWTDWAKSLEIGMDFNPSFFAHPKAASGLTLTHPDRAIRRFWIEHGIACRRIGESIGRALGKPCVTNVWIPDGSKDNPVDRRSPRLRLDEALDEIFSREVDPAFNVDAVESKLFGIGSECYVAGSHEFYLAYAVRNNKVLCLDMGHFHPTESVADKISALLVHLDAVLLHVSRGVRWDSDHVVILNDDLQAVADELVRGGYLDRVYLALDYFDASINRIVAWVTGMRNLQKALLVALLEPLAALRAAEHGGDNTGRLALLEEAKMMPVAPVWDCFCLRANVPVGSDWLTVVRDYEKHDLSKR
jgi:L-rhamnose isomerase